jgi:hypothetical protein
MLQQVWSEKSLKMFNSTETVGDLLLVYKRSKICCDLEAHYFLTAAIDRLVLHEVNRAVMCYAFRGLWFDFSLHPPRGFTQSLQKNNGIVYYFK